MDSTSSDHDQHFRTDHLQADLKGHSVRGGAINLVSQACKFSVRVASTVVLARLLDREAFGLIAMVVAVTRFTELFKDLGLSMATVQRAEVDHRQISTLFWANVILGAALMFLIGALAPVIAWLYHEPRLILITLVLAVMVGVGGLSVQHLAVLRRQMRFSALAVVDLVSLTSGAVVAIVFACFRPSHWALVAQIVASQLMIMILAWRICAWRPGRASRGSGAREMIRFGGHLSASRILVYLRRNLDHVLIGAAWGADLLGQYFKAYELLLIPVRQINGPISHVVVPALSRLQNQSNRFRRYFKMSMSIVVMFGMPLVAFLFVMTEDVVRVLLGEKWLEITPIFRALAPAAFVGTFNSATSWVFISLGRTDRQFRMGIFSTLVTVLSFAAGLPWGPIGVAWSYSIATCVIRYPCVHYCYRTSPLKAADLFEVLWRPAVASIVAAGCLYAIDRQFFPNAHVALALIVGFALYVCMYGLIWLVLPQGRHTLSEAVALARQLRQGSGANTPDGID